MQISVNHIEIVNTVSKKTAKLTKKEFDTRCTEKKRKYTNDKQNKGKYKTDKDKKNDDKE